MLCWAFKANFANFNRRANTENFFNDMSRKRARSERKSVTHVYAHCVTHVCAPCREGERSSQLNCSGRAFLRLPFEYIPSCENCRAPSMIEQRLWSPGN